MIFKPCFFILKALKVILQHFKIRELENSWFRFLMSRTGYMIRRIKEIAPVENLIIKLRDYFRKAIYAVNHQNSIQKQQ